MTQNFGFFLIIIVVLFLRTVRVALSSPSSQKLKRESDGAKLLVVIGSGGHTAEMVHICGRFCQTRRRQRREMIFPTCFPTRVYLRGFGYDERGENRAIRAGRSARRNEWRVQESFRPESERGWTELFHERFYNVVGVLALLESVLEDETRRDINERTRTCVPVILACFLGKVFGYNSACKVMYVEKRGEDETDELEWEIVFTG